MAAIPRDRGAHGHRHIRVLAENAIDAELGQTCRDARGLTVRGGLRARIEEGTGRLRRSAPRRDLRRRANSSRDGEKRRRSVAYGARGDRERGFVERRPAQPVLSA
jgi:hypothetical protein